MSDENGSANAGNPAGAAAAGTAPPASSAPWFGADAGDDVKAFVTTKGWDHPIKAIKSYQNLETLLGQDKAGKALYLPKDENDAEGWSKIYERLGRPADWKGYDLPKPEGDDGKFAEAFGPILHQAGLTKTQAQTIAKAWNEYGQKQNAELDAKAQAQADNDERTLKAEWGNRFDTNIAAGQRAAKAIGLTAEDVEAIESARGYSATMKMFAKMGELLGEDKFVGSGPGEGEQSKEAARAELQALQNDKEFAAKLIAGDASAKMKWEKARRAAA